MREIPKPFEQYMHFKGKKYQILAIAKHSETMQQMVVYQAMYGDNGIYVRPLDMFLSEVDHVKYPGVKQKYRFAHIGVDEVVLEDVPINFVSLDEEPLKESSQKEPVQQSEQTPELSAQQYAQALEQSMPQSSQEQVAPVWEDDHQESNEEEEVQLDPLLLEFLDANTTEDRINILTGLHARITHEMINTIAVVLDLDVPDGDLEDRYAQVKYALFTKKKYEGTRMR